MAFLMKHCPQCGAEYDDYVQFCFVDGVALVEGPGTAPKATLPYSTPVPPAPAGSMQSPPSLPPPPGVRPALAAAKPRAGDGRGVSMWAVGLLLVPVILLFAVGGLVVAVLIVNSGSEEQVSTAPAPAPPHPAPAPSQTSPGKAPAPPSEPVRRVSFESEPPGAEVWEGSFLLCPATPCSIEHPDHAPDDRKFTLKLKDHQDTEYVLDDPSAVQHVTLPTRNKTTRPRPKSGDDILIER